jgi:hypothetical protein
MRKTLVVKSKKTTKSAFGVIKGNKGKGKERTGSDTGPPPEGSISPGVD